MLVGSPPCTAFSNIQNLNARTPEGAIKVEEAKRQATIHLQFCAAMYREQLRNGRYVLHEHPDTASSWGEHCVSNLLKKQGVVRVTGDQWMYGLKAKDGVREGLARKRTGFLINSPCIAKKLDLRCPNTKANQQKQSAHIAFIANNPNNKNIIKNTVKTQ